MTFPDWIAWLILTVVVVLAVGVAVCGVLAVVAWLVRGDR